MPDDVPADEKMRRFRALEDLQKEVVGNLNAAYQGKTLPVLFEGKSKNRWRGRTPTNRLVFVETEQDLLGQERDVRINWTGPWSLLGDLLD